MDIEKLDWKCPALQHDSSNYIVMCVAQTIVDVVYKLWEAVDADPTRPWAVRSYFQDTVARRLEQFQFLLADWKVLYAPEDIIHLRLQAHKAALTFHFTIDRKKPRTAVTMLRVDFDGTTVGEMNVFAPIFDDTLADKQVMRKVYIEVGEKR